MGARERVWRVTQVPNPAAPESQVRANSEPDRPEAERGEALLRVVLLAYVVLAVLYALVTPAWQAPDEPAHYNYVVHVAEQGVLPELLPGDYPAAYLEQIKAARFPVDMSIAPIRYESHQPPLYYLVASVIYRLGKALLPLQGYLTLRLFSVLIGALALMLAYRLVSTLYPGEPAVAVGAAAFWGTLPMHLSMVSAINNDVLAELLLNFVVLKLVSMRIGAWSYRRAVGLGAALGLALLCKFQSYSALGVAAAALLYDLWATRRTPGRLTWGRALQYGGVMLATALLVASPWIVRNVTLYGLRDPLGLVRHAEVVSGQLTTQQYIAQHGWLGWLRAYAVTTFHSFWGQFGWMGVPLPTNVYVALGVLSGLSALGLLAYAVRVRRGAEPLTAGTRRGLVLLTVWAAIALLGYLWWNTQYVQHQGRYLFPALPAWATGFALGLREIVRRGRWLALGALATGGAALLASGLLQGDVYLFGVVLLAVAAGLVLAGHWVERRWPGWALAGAYGGLALFAAACLYVYIAPALAL